MRKFNRTFGSPQVSIEILGTEEQGTGTEEEHPVKATAVIEGHEVTATGRRNSKHITFRHPVRRSVLGLSINKMMVAFIQYRLTSSR